MKELNIMEATVLTSPNPLTLICSKGGMVLRTWLPICFVSYLSFNPPMVGFCHWQTVPHRRVCVRPAKSSSLFPARVWLAQ